MKRYTRYKNEYVVSYADYGDKSGFPILVNHGLIASITDCHLFDQAVERGARLISIARPGYGESAPYRVRDIAEWADIASVVIDELGLARVDVLGMSSGAPYSYAIGHKFRDRVRKIYIFSGIPALFDQEVLSSWPFDVDKNADLAALQTLAHELFFANLSEEDFQRNDIKDSMMHHCFGIAQDFKLRCLDWGFRLSEVKPYVHMRHSRQDTAVPFAMALRTSKLLPNCFLEISENGEHFSKEALDDFIHSMITAYNKDVDQKIDPPIFPNHYMKES
ncbi:MAG TPA: alpha/beta hydrolase [Anaerolineales bacterium]|nr:alpha/beta hydrolase [Anaerolineales bacterium]